METEPAFEKTVIYKCRRWRLPWTKQQDLAAKFAKGELKCPFEGLERSVEVTNPADNIARNEIARKLNTPCSLCGLTPEPEDFETK